ncbi:dihydroxyacetone kinase subunit DhaL [Lactonifactor longoviformis]|uniref:dihydroxyacetone kinase subunit DhaL n=1 Tax=Lactonifactor longoviformis TaxID=341220 RepID=UPI001D003C9B|nr:dihydroxyacetone kinase subunit DhaL [Lactonifactor longoviformis]MCB5711121.1 dihydroxyacetone kinase subunit L [Lactonifactor longoviformis]MCB5715088.1 dihydroxyacetone kinase subunit L [Lactonifactor longoviformis]
MFQIYKEDYLRYLTKAAGVIRENKEYITELDSATGDGDHWLNLTIGFEKLLEKSKEWEGATYQELFRNIAMTMMSAMGGSSGVLYGSAYLKTAGLLANRESIDQELLGEILQGWAEAIRSRGNAELGYKTMLDAVYPAASAYAKGLEEGKSSEECLRQMARAAREGAESTRDMEAVKGRASYREDKSVGFLDPGAVTMAMQLECLADFILKEDKAPAAKD